MLRARRGRSIRGASLSFSADSRWLVRGSRIWDLNASNLTESSITLYGHTGGIYMTAISSDARWIVTGSDDSTVRLWPFEVDELLKLGLRLAGRELTADERRTHLVDTDVADW